MVALWVTVVVMVEWVVTLCLTVVVMVMVVKVMV